MPKGMGPGKGMMPPKKMNFKSLTKVIKLMFKGNEVGTILVLVFTLLSAIFSALAMGMNEELFDVVIPKLQETKNQGEGLEALTNLMIKIGLLFVLSTLFTAAQGFISVHISQSTIKDVRHRMFSNMQYLPIKYFDTNKYGDIMSKYTNDVDTLDNFITQTVPNLISVTTSVIALFVMMLINNYLLIIITIVLLVLILMLSGVLVKKSARFFMARQKLVGKLNAYSEEMLEGARVVQTFNYQDKAIKNFKEINKNNRDVEMKANMIGNIIGPLNGNLVRIEYVILAIIGSLMVLLEFKTFKGIYTVGMLITYLTYTNSFCNPVARFAQQLTMVAQASAGSERIIDLMNAPHETDEGYVTLVNYELDNNGNYIEKQENNHKWAWKHPHQDGTIEYVPLKGNIVLDKVDFSYNEGHQILFDIDIYANPGERIALVGETGAGKTTITNLINRFYDIEDGKIRYDGININKIKKYDLRKSLGLVLQDTNLFSGTIKENIKLGKPDATDEEVINAAKIANADGFIRMMPNGYDTYLVKAGEKLSQGQRQLIAIARAAIADSPVLILDEATSSIDTRTELIVQNGMDKLMQGRTTFVIAHRLSTIQNSNAIMVMDHGKIIERGTHNSLIEKKGVYYQLYTGKFELE